MSVISEVENNYSLTVRPVHLLTFCHQIAGGFHATTLVCHISAAHWKAMACIVFRITSVYNIQTHTGSAT